eukprot:COSAG03_NODE_496_length_7430_cov_3.744237_1_plen_59_part_00
MTADNFVAGFLAEAAARQYRQQALRARPIIAPQANPEELSSLGPVHLRESAVFALIRR